MFMIHFVLSNEKPKLFILKQPQAHLLINASSNNIQNIGSLYGKVLLVILKSYNQTIMSTVNNVAMLGLSNLYQNKTWPIGSEYLTK